LPTNHSFARKDVRSIGQKLLVTNGLNPDIPTLITVAMMRNGDKYASYCALADALDRISDRSWQLLIVGDGPMRHALEQRFASLGKHRVKFLGALQGSNVASSLYASDIFVWPAINEAYGMAILEAQAAGLPVIAGNSGGVGQIVHNGKTGILTKEGNIKDLADAVGSLLTDSTRRSAMGKAAKQVVKKDHSFEQAAIILDSILVNSKKGKER
jgi:glycosyltransferase involved in cell wall biosynthesis